LGPLHSITTCLRKSFDFSGRASRAEFWMHLALCFVVIILLQLFFTVTILPVKEFGTIEIDGVKTRYSLLSILGFFIPLLLSASMLAVTARRFQDYGWSGRWFRWMFYLVGLAVILAITAVLGAFVQNPTMFNASFYYGFMAIFPPFASVFWTFWIGFLPSSPGPNRYGPNPREVTP
jgi:uncharacterized membrane protein YhaH (DUF805 family)